MATPRPQHVPDILDCLAQLSNDEVPTPPVLARAMLDLLPDEVWSEPDYKWLDPGCKSGVFLREVAIRLLDGLSDWEPDFVKRREHIFREMLHGAPITEMTGHISRRTVYYSRDASGDHSVILFDTESGNLPFITAEHDFQNGKCDLCGAPVDLERGERRENYAYSFLHNAYPTEEMADMQFDVIVGNPPYQVESGGHGAQAKPVYHRFVEKAISMNPRHLVMITPSRWFTGGFQLDAFRDRMLADRHLAVLVDNPKLFDCFPGVEIKGGVSYFRWDRDHDGDCEFSTRVDGIIKSTQIRDLRRGDGVLVRDNQALSIIEKVTEAVDERLSDVVSPLWPFVGQTNPAGISASPFPDSVPMVFGSRVGYARLDQIQRNHDWIDQWKVLLPAAGDGHGREVSYVTGEPIALGPGSVCTGTYLVAGRFDSADEARNYALFLSAKLVRFLIQQRKATHHLTQDCFKFVPDLDMTRSWNDAELFDLFDLDEEERAYVDRTIQPREANLFLDVPVPSSHLPGGSKHRATE